MIVWPRLLRYLFGKRHVRNDQSELVGRARCYAGSGSP